MAFRRTYDEILELIKKQLLSTPLARAIVRKSGVRPGSSTSGEDGEPGFLFASGDPWDAIVKLSDTDYNVGWRKNGIGPEDGLLPDVGNSGPPCNLRALQFLRLRDSLLRSGTSNGDRFGYAFDRHGRHTQEIAGPSFGFYYERQDYGGASQYNLDYQGRFVVGSGTNRDIIDEVNSFTGPQARVIAYITRADFPWTINLRLLLSTSATPTVPATHLINGTGTGRVVSDWLDFPAFNTSLNPGYLADKIWGNGDAFAWIDATDDSSIGPVPTTYDELREGAGPLCCPFLEVEVRTLYYAERSYWIQDEFTPDEYRVAEWETEV